jgi:hypothetical protein
MSARAHHDDCASLGWSDRWLPSRRQATLVAAWCIAYFLITLLGRLHESMWILLAWLGIWIAAGLIFLISLLHLRELARVPAAVLLTVALLPLTVAALTPSLNRVAARMSFELRRGDYDAVVARVEGGSPSLKGGETGRGTRFLVDAGPPRRVAFVTLPGVVDNWAGIVHDPSHQVAAARGLAGDPVRELFGGDIVSCRHISEAYYECGFT